MPTTDPAGSESRPDPPDSPPGSANAPPSSEAGRPLSRAGEPSEDGAAPGWLTHLPELDFTDPVEAELVEAAESPLGGCGAPWRGRQLKRRRVWLPVILFAVTCLSTFWAGATEWSPMFVLKDALESGNLMPVRRALIVHWSDGLIYMACVLAILLTHEMGHFLTTVRYRVPASLPYFLPLPITPIGTLGAVIGMDGLRANRRELFDIGLAGPLAGLVVAAPILWIGVRHLDFTHSTHRVFAVDCPLAVRLLLEHVRPPGYTAGVKIWSGQLNPYFMAGWIGLLVTGLNMLPVSQLDGGHVTYTVFGKHAHWMARGFMLLAIAFIVLASAYIWTLMLLLVLLIGTDHPPTRDDTMRLGWTRTAIGLASLSIPILCFPPLGLITPQ